jgi:hypothetical protein
MRVTVKPRLLAIPSVFRLSDLHLIAGDLAVARKNFSATIGNNRIISHDSILSYSLCCSGLIHYRRAFNTGVRRYRLTDEIVSEVAPTYFELHRYLWDMADKYVAHSCNEFEQLLATVHVAEGDDGIFRFSGIGRQASAIELLSEQGTSQSILLINLLISGFIEPEVARLEDEVRNYCAKLSSEELKALPDGFAPPGNANPKRTRVWPYSRIEKE